MTARLFIGRLSSRATERDVKDFFKGYGEIVNISLKEGYGFVELADVRDAKDAIHDLDRKELCGTPVAVEASNRRPGGRGGRYEDDRSGSRGGRYDSERSYQGGRGYARPTSSRYPPPVSTNYRLIVDNLSSRCSWQDLKDMVRSCAEATYADAHKREKNTGLLCFASHSDLKRVMKKFQGEEINGRKIKLVDDSRASSRSRSRSASRSPPRIRRRSRSRSRSPPTRATRSRSPATRAVRSCSPATRAVRSRSVSLSRSPPKKTHKRSPSSSRSRSRSRSSVTKGRSGSRSRSSSVSR